MSVQMRQQPSMKKCNIIYYLFFVEMWGVDVSLFYTYKQLIGCLQHRTMQARNGPGVLYTNA